MKSSGRVSVDWEVYKDQDVLTSPKSLSLHVGLVPALQRQGFCFDQHWRVQRRWGIFVGFQPCVKVKEIVHLGFSEYQLRAKIYPFMKQGLFLTSCSESPWISRETAPQGIPLGWCGKSTPQGLIRSAEAKWVLRRGGPQKGCISSGPVTLTTAIPNLVLETSQTICTKGQRWHLITCILRTTGVVRHRVWNTKGCVWRSPIARPEPASVL